MFDWIFKRSAKDCREGDHFVEPKFSDEQNIAPNGQDQLEQTEQDLIQIRDTLAHVLSSMANKVASLEEQLDQAQEQKTQLEVRLKKLNIQDDIAMEVKTLREERGLIISGMFEAQEELEKQLHSQKEFEQEAVVLNKRFDRLLKRYKNYVDFDQLAILSCDAVSQDPEITWEMTSCFFSGITFEKIKFKSFMKEGKVGILIMSLTKAESNAINFKQEATLFPELLRVDPEQKKLLQKIQSSHWHAFGAAIAAIDLTIKTNWRDIRLPESFDPQFWSSCFQSLAINYARQPKVLRFERVHLKQEQVNADYEHLWFELFDVSFGHYLLPKFEFRIAASQVHPKEFSNYPKLEIPLIDGKIKPFESWYPESFDDFGSKFELRFDLNRNSLDLAVWSKLSKVDREFVFGLIQMMPIILSQKHNQELKINRPIRTWSQFSNQVFNLMYSILFGKEIKSSEKRKDDLIHPDQAGGLSNIAIKSDPIASKNIKKK